MDVVKKARELFIKDQAYWSEVYERAKEDIYFLSDADDAQWDSKDIQSRRKTGRPSLTIDQLTQFVNQVVNDIRMNTPTINVIPSDTRSSQENAEVIKGLIKNIEYVSSADDVYDTAVNFSVKGGIGFIRIDHDYVDEDSFDQELLIKRVTNPFSVIIDSSSIESDGRDMRHAFVIDLMSKEEFTKQYPDKIPSDFQTAGDDVNVQDKDKIMIVEFFMIEDKDIGIGINDDGSTEEMQDGKAYKAARKTKKRVVKRYKLSGSDVLEETTFPGKYIPIVPVFGEEVWINGKRYAYSLIRRAKDSQRLFNVMKSNEIETLLKQPKAPWIAADGQIQDVEAWVNPDDSDVLIYDTRDKYGQPASAPQRIQPAAISPGFYQASLQATDDIKATLGMYNASLGARSNETSGKAITARKIEGDVATYHFGDNLVKAITQVGRIIVCAIPEIYDTSRALRIIGDEEEVKSVGVNGMMVENQKEEYDLTQGKYDVRVVTGAPFTTRRQEAAAFFADVVTKMPDLMSVMGDLLFKYSDVAGAEAMASRMKKVVDPKFLEEEDRLKLEEAQQQEQIDPEKQQMVAVIQQGAQELQAMQQEIVALKQQLESKQYEAVAKTQEAEAKAQIEAYKLQLEERKILIEEQKIQKDSEVKAAELQLKALEMQLMALNPPSSEDDSKEEDNGMEMSDQQEMELKAMQTAAILESIASVKASLDSLTNGINRPKTVVYGEDGSILGVQ